MRGAFRHAKRAGDSIFYDDSQQGAIVESGKRFGNPANPWLFSPAFPDAMVVVISFSSDR
jgi:hypothetical protein